MAQKRTPKKNEKIFYTNDTETVVRYSRGNEMYPMFGCQYIHRFSEDLATIIEANYLHVITEEEAKEVARKIEKEEENQRAQVIANKTYALSGRLKMTRIEINNVLKNTFLNDDLKYDLLENLFAQIGTIKKAFTEIHYD